MWSGEDWISAKELHVGDELDGEILTRKEQLSPQQWIDFTVDADHSSYFHKGILHHNSGKSLIAYLMIKWHLEQYDHKTMLIVPSTNLCMQMFNDFKDYSSENQFDVDANVQVVFGKHSTEITKPIQIVTWQSVHSKGKGDGYFGSKEHINSYDFILIDEAHNCSAASLTGIMEKAVDVPYRVGMTGTLSGAKANALVITGLTGDEYRVVTTRELIDRQQVSDVSIKCVNLKYSKLACKALKDADYQTELDWIISNSKRNQFLANLAVSRPGNVLMLFTMVERHGKVLYELLQSMNTGKQIFMIYGGTETETREEIRALMECNSDMIICGSYGTMSTGVSIRNLTSVIYASPAKSRIRVLQSLGRGLRLSDNKTHCTLFDISDNLSNGKKHNHTMRHLMERVKMYSEENFSYKITEVQMGDV